MPPPAHVESRHPQRPSSDVDPWCDHPYRLLLPGVDEPVAAFTEIGGLPATERGPGSARTTTRPAGEPRDPLVAIRLFTQHKYTVIRCPNGVALHGALCVWHRNIVHGVADRRNATVTLADGDGVVVGRWTIRAWISRCFGLDVRADLGAESRVTALDLCATDVRTT